MGIIKDFLISWFITRDDNDNTQEQKLTLKQIIEMNDKERETKIKQLEYEAEILRDSILHFSEMRMYIKDKKRCDELKIKIDELEKQLKCKKEDIERLKNIWW